MWNRNDLCPHATGVLAIFRQTPRLRDLVELPRFNVLGVDFHAVDLARTTGLLLHQPEELQQRTVTFCDADSLRWARHDPRHRSHLNHAWLNLPDTGPVAWLGRLAGHRGSRRVRPRDLFDSICHATRDGSRSHFFYGGEPGTATALADALLQRYPGLMIAGTHSPLPLADDVEDLPVNAITLAKPDYLWIGLPCPEQEAFLHRLARSDADFGTALGVHGVFENLRSGARRRETREARDSLDGLWPAQEPGT
jgi:N-acetylglucosaminyldiphosphoundecaprenol N-acetyl-beta-D-mannosaminyltransferase